MADGDDLVEFAWNGGGTWFHNVDELVGNGYFDGRFHDEDGFRMIGGAIT